MTGDIGEALRAQPVGERVRRVLFEIGGVEEIGHLVGKSGTLAPRTQGGQKGGGLEELRLKTLLKNWPSFNPIRTYMGHAPVPDMYNYLM